jgi:hypothetical protein
MTAEEKVRNKWGPYDFLHIDKRWDSGFNLMWRHPTSPTNSGVFLGVGDTESEVWEDAERRLG